nr:antitoxin Xre/MbcA/ParS toxin-binding domain-containing protein [Natronocella acetinitrilica]
MRSLDVLLATSWVRLADIKHILPPRKLRSRAEKGARLTTEESEKVLRIARVAEAATDFFGDKGKADKWMRSPKRFLDGKAPADIMHMESGAWLIENHLLQSEHGFAA